MNISKYLSSVNRLKYEFIWASMVDICPPSSSNLKKLERYINTKESYLLSFPAQHDGARKHLAEALGDDKAANELDDVNRNIRIQYFYILHKVSVPLKV